MKAVHSCKDLQPRDLGLFWRGVRGSFHVDIRQVSSWCDDVLARNPYMVRRTVNLSYKKPNSNLKLPVKEPEGPVSRSPRPGSNGFYGCFNNLGSTSWVFVQEEH